MIGKIELPKDQKQKKKSQLLYISQVSIKNNFKWRNWCLFEKTSKHTVLKVTSFVNYMQTVDEQNQVKNNISKIGYNFSKI